MNSASVSTTTLLPRINFVSRWREQIAAFLFSPDDGEWLGILRIGLGLAVVSYTLSLRSDWHPMFAQSSTGFLSREFTEAVLSIQNPFVPRLGWLIAIGERIGLSENAALTALWILFFTAGSLLITGLFSRSAAVIAWLLHLSTQKSGEYLSYGVDNFLTIGLFYLMIAPLPGPWALQSRIWRVRPRDSAVMGFFRRVLQLHLCVIYFFGGLTKCLGAGWWTGNSMWRALIRPPFDLISSQTLIHWQPFLLVLGIAVCLLETTFPIFIWPKATRATCLIAIVGMHIGIAFTMGLYLFSIVMIVLDVAAFGPVALRWPLVRSRPVRSDLKS